MSRFFTTAITLIGIVLAFVGCNQSEPEQQNSQEQSKPITTVTTVAGTKISASSLSELQTTINNTDAGSVIDLSQCSGISGTLTIDKSLTVRNYSNLLSDLIITDANVTLTGMTVNSVTTQQSGSSGLKIANSSLSTLTLGGDGVARSDSRAESKPKVLIFDSIVKGAVDLNEAVELDIATIDGLNIGSFTGNAEATINMTASAYSEYQGKYPSGNQNIYANNNITDETAYGYLNEFGYAGANLLLKSQAFPSDCVGYISKLLKSYKNDAPDVPSPDLTVESDNSADFFQYYWSAYSQSNTVATMDGAVLSVDIPLKANFDKDAYEAALKQAGYTDGPSGLEYTNQYEIEAMFDELESQEIDESNYVEAMKKYNDMMTKIYNMVVYNVEVVIDWDWYYDENDDQEATPKYNITYSFFAVKYGDLTKLP